MIPLISNFFYGGPCGTCEDCGEDLCIDVGSVMGSVDVKNNTSLRSGILRRIYADIYRKRFNCACGSLSCRHNYWVEQGADLIGPMCGMCYMDFVDTGAGDEMSLEGDVKVYRARNESKLWEQLEKASVRSLEDDPEDDWGLDENEMIF